MGNKVKEHIYIEEESFLKVNEEKIGYAVVHLMKHWEEVFEDGGGHKYNKNQVLVYFARSHRHVMRPCCECHD